VGCWQRVGRHGIHQPSCGYRSLFFWKSEPTRSLSLLLLQVYVWGRRHQYVNLSFLGIFTFTAPYLPWVLLAFSGLRRLGAVAACSL
jgi:hypothetical protein